MEQYQSEVQEETHNESPTSDGLTATAASSIGLSRVLCPQACASCGATLAANGGPTSTPKYVYAIGRIEARFPSISVEKEFAQATGRADTKGLTDRQALQAVLSKP